MKVHYTRCVHKIQYKTLHLIMIVLFSIIALLFKQAQAQDAQVVFEGSLRHQRQLAGFEFQIESSRWLDGDYDEYGEYKRKPDLLFSHRDPIEYTETLALDFVPSDMENPWRTRWICGYPGPQPLEPWFAPRAFFVLTDKSLHTFVRPDFRLLDDNGPRNHEDFFRQATAGARVVGRRLATVDYRHYDLVGIALTANAHMDSIYFDPLGNVTRDIEGWQFAGSSTHLGRRTLKLTFKGDNPNESSETEVLDSPHYTVVRYLASYKTPRGDSIYRSFVSDRLSEYDGIVYPSAGTVKEMIAKREDGSYLRNAADFGVINVQKVSAKTRDNWVPRIPQGSTVTENNKIRHVPFSDDVRLAKIVEMTREGEVRRRSSAWLWSIAVLTLAGVLFVLATIKRSYRDANT